MTVFGTLDKPKINSAEDYNFFVTSPKTTFKHNLKINSIDHGASKYFIYACPDLNY